MFHKKSKIKVLKAVLPYRPPVSFLNQLAAFSEPRSRQKRNRNLLSKKQIKFSKDSLFLLAIRLTRKTYFHCPLF